LLPQVFHTWLPRAVFQQDFACVLLIFCAGFFTSAPVAAQDSTPHSAPSFRIFLKEGQGLPAFAEPAIVGDRIVFQLEISLPADAASQPLVSLPVAAVDVERTARYSEAVRAAQYAVTRGDADYEAMSQEVARALAELEKIDNEDQRRALASLARQRLLDWSRAHYAYRAQDIQELAGLFDDVARTRVEPGERALTLDLVAGPAPPVREPLQPPPDLRASIELALAAAAASDIPDERASILRTAAGVAGGAAPDLAAIIAARLESEAASAAAYAAFGKSLLARADAARRRGDVAAVERLRQELANRDRELGYRRPDDVAAMQTELTASLERTRAHRLALDHYSYVKPALLAYERRIRPALTGLSQQEPLLEAIREMRSVGFANVERAINRLKALEETVRSTSAPEDLAAVHATLASALQMAREACERRRLAVITNKTQTAREASSAAAGALLLAGAVKADLVMGLFPPKAE
jgi:hypothetical protein